MKTKKANKNNNTFSPSLNDLIQTKQGRVGFVYGLGMYPYWVKIKFFGSNIPEDIQIENLEACEFTWDQINRMENNSIQLYKGANDLIKRLDIVADHEHTPKACADRIREAIRRSFLTIAIKDINIK